MATVPGEALASILSAQGMQIKLGSLEQSPPWNWGKVRVGVQSTRGSGKEMGEKGET